MSGDAAEDRETAGARDRDDRAELADAVRRAYHRGYADGLAAALDAARGFIR